jgi:hypothetical protein
MPKKAKRGGNVHKKGRKRQNNICLNDSIDFYYGKVIKACGSSRFSIESILTGEIILGTIQNKAGWCKENNIVIYEQPDHFKTCRDKKTGNIKPKGLIVKILTNNELELLKNTDIILKDYMNDENENTDNIDFINESDDNPELDNEINLDII